MKQELIAFSLFTRIEGMAQARTSRWWLPVSHPPNSA